MLTDHSKEELVSKLEELILVIMKTEHNVVQDPINNNNSTNIQRRRKKMTYTQMIMLGLVDSGDEPEANRFEAKETLPQEQQPTQAPKTIVNMISRKKWGFLIQKKGPNSGSVLILQLRYAPQQLLTEGGLLFLGFLFVRKELLFYCRWMNMCWFVWKPFLSWTSLDGRKDD